MADFNFESARHNMVVSQIRTYDVFDDRLLELFAHAPREDFVPAELRNLAFVDMQIPLGNGEVMMAPLIEARLIQALAVKSTDSVLEIGTGSGYVTWLLSRLAERVTSVEIRPEFTQQASEKLAAHGANNVALEIGDGARGWSSAGPYDAIFVTGSVPILTPDFQNQLRMGGRLAVIVGTAPAMDARIITRLTETAFDTQSLFETVLPPLRNAPTPSPFRF